MKFSTYQKLQYEHHDCHWHGCSSKGEYPAPKEPGNTKDYHVFCLEHVRIYNKKWNYFSSMNEDQILDFQKDSMTGHRPTKARHHSSFIFHANDILEEILDDFGFHPSDLRSEAPGHVQTVSESTLHAMKVLQLQAPMTERQIKAQYKKLAKTCHPDIHGEASADRFKELNAAYSHLLKASDKVMVMG